MTSAHIAAATGSKDVMTELTQFNKLAISAKNKVVISSVLCHSSKQDLSASTTVGLEGTGEVAASRVLRLSSLQN